MRVAAIIVTRGDVEVERVTASLPAEWERLVWSNGTGGLLRWSNLSASVERIDVPDLAVYGRYAAIEYTDADLIYVQDDDCIVSDPMNIVSAHCGSRRFVTCNMPLAFRHSFYEEHALVGFGACFHRDAPARAFSRYEALVEASNVSHVALAAAAVGGFYRTCDIVFTGLTPRVLVDIPYENLPWATDDNRMYRQPEHIAERQRMLDLVRQVRDS